MFRDGSREGFLLNNPCNEKHTALFSTGKTLVSENHFKS